MIIRRSDLWYEKGDLYINESLLTRELKIPHRAFNNIRHRNKTGKYKGWKYKYLGVQWFYLYDTITNRSPKYYRTKLPNKQELIVFAEYGKRGDNWDTSMHYIKASVE